MPGETTTSTTTAAAAGASTAADTGAGKATPAQGSDAGGGAAADAKAGGTTTTETPKTSVLGDAFKATETAAVLDLKMPEGFKPDDEILGELKKHASTLKLDSKGAQPFVDLGARMVAKIQTTQKQAHEAQVADWAKALPAVSRELGSTHEQTLADAGSVVQRFGDKELKTLFDSSGVGNHPAIYRLLAKAGAYIRERLGEDSSKVPTTKTSNGTPKSAASSLYDHPDSRRVMGLDKH